MFFRVTYQFLPATVMEEYSRKRKTIKQTEKLMKTKQS